MSLHPLATRFASVADAYERGRPEYPPAAVGALAAELELAPRARILDLAAGTGKLARALLAGGFDVVAVEPQGSLREALVAGIGAERVHEGLAEAIPLPGSSVDAVTVADAFHWFDPPRALAEIRRVLRPRGGLAVITALPDWRGASWAHELGELIARHRGEHPHFDGQPWQESVRVEGSWTEPRTVVVTAPQDADPERLLDYVASISWVAAMGDAERTELLERAEAIVRGGHTPPQLAVRLIIGLARLV
jgi:SAM-dependent methyltransferase